MSSMVAFATKEESLNLLIGQLHTLLKMCTAGAELFRIVFCFKFWKHEKEKGRKEACYKALMITIYEFKKKQIMRVTGYRREERMRVVEVPFREVTERTL